MVVFFFSTMSSIFFYTTNPMTPAAIRGPAFPVVPEFSCPPRPISSSPANTTMDRPITECGPSNCTNPLSCTETTPEPFSAISILPKSPAMRFSSVGAPCVLPVLELNYIKSASEREREKQRISKRASELESSIILS